MHPVASAGVQCLSAGVHDVHCVMPVGGDVCTYSGVATPVRPTVVVVVGDWAVLLVLTVGSCPHQHQHALGCACVWLHQW